MTPSESWALTIRPSPSSVDGLVVVALRVRRFADQCRHAGARHCADGRGREDRVALLVVGVAEHVGQVLVQRPAQRDVEYLGAAADAQHRHAAPHGTAKQCEFPRVPRAVVGDGLVGGRVRLLAITGGIDVAPTGDDQAIQAVKNTVGDVGVDGLRRQQYRDPPGEIDPFEVDGGQKTGAHIPDPGLRLLQICGEPDHRPRFLSAAPAQAGDRRKLPRHAGDFASLLRLLALKLEPLKATHPFPVGHRGIERGQFDAGIVQVVLDDVVAERLARHLRLTESAAASASVVGRRSAPLV